MAVLVIAPQAADIRLHKLGSGVDVERNERLRGQAHLLGLAELLQPGGRVCLTIGFL